MAGCGRAHPVITICNAEPKDAESILALQKLAYQSEAELYSDGTLPPPSDKQRNDGCPSPSLSPAPGVRKV
jgi:hypothetical protein